ncbi:hypothetical protein Enr13x_06990 [Stieleria neptunia]|uniref:Uncharacterized protein n=1 Tax=Stieleria neptunia TaxID=2527979 RepID=A0A518HJ71_9BACT|nr:hypothetical protein Enr13x_06990 [Stieleria neptunia]
MKQRDVITSTYRFTSVAVSPDSKLLSAGTLHEGACGFRLTPRVGTHASGKRERAARGDEGGEDGRKMWGRKMGDKKISPIRSRLFRSLLPYFLSRFAR